MVQLKILNRQRRAHRRLCIVCMDVYRKIVAMNKWWKFRSSKVCAETIWNICSYHIHNICFSFTLFETALAKNGVVQWWHRLTYTFACIEQLKDIKATKNTIHIYSLHWISFLLRYHVIQCFNILSLFILVFLPFPFPFLSHSTLNALLSIGNIVHCHRDNRSEGMDLHARKKLIIASILCLLFMCLEIVGGIWSNSLAIATDAAHLLTDFASFMISLFSIWIAGRPSTRKWV